MLRLFLLALALSCALALPTNFDARSKWGSQCQYNILNQGGCGSCWDFASSESFADRLCITREAPNGTIISPQYVLNCIASGSCNGGATAHAWQFFESSGDTTCGDLCADGCVRYQAKDTLACKTTCDNGSRFPATYIAGGFKGTYSGDLNAAMTELYNNGPIQTSFGVYQNFSPFFNQHPNGIYDTTNGTAHVGSHAVKVIGWGVQNGEKYWLAANSWGAGFATKGYFKFARGTGICGFDASMQSGFTKKQALAAGVFGIFDETPDRPLDGGKFEQEATDEWMVEVARKAVELKAEETGKELELVEVLAAETQVVAGTKYYFKVSTKEGAAKEASEVELVVLEDIEANFSLVY